MTAPIPHDERISTLITEFEQRYGRPPEGIAEAPGRVNLIGEHVDYNDGLVLPFAIDRSVLCAWGSDELKFPKHGDNQADRIVVESLEFPDVDSFYPNIDADYRPAPDAPMWTRYVRGVYDELLSSVPVTAWSFPQHGGRFILSGDVPQGAGLSSSAALEVAVAGAFRDAFALPGDDVALAQLCQRAENEYVGVQCGIMDQFASTLAKRDHALLIDCRTLAYEHVPLRLAASGLAAVIVNSGVSRELAGGSERQRSTLLSRAADFMRRSVNKPPSMVSGYNQRRAESAEALALLRHRLHRPDLASLRDVTAADLDALAIESVPMRRARHVVTEIGRVAATVDALAAADFAAVGRLMLESHASLRDDYDVSSPELDLLVGLAMARDYVVGARLTGAGFGGCTINLVQADAVARFEAEVVAPYRERTGRKAEIYVTSPADGLRTWRV